MASPRLKQRGSHFIPQIASTWRNWKVSLWSYQVCLETYDLGLYIPLGTQASQKHRGL